MWYKGSRGGAGGSSAVEEPSSMEKDVELAGQSESGRWVQEGKGTGTRARYVARVFCAATVFCSRLPCTRCVIFCRLGGSARAVASISLLLVLSGSGKL